MVELIVSNASLFSNDFYFLLSVKFSTMPVFLSIAYRVCRGRKAQ
ncbi:hypothetical protein OHD23_29010 [Escherichia coli]|nr:hypothetical protein [Escherichia coli]